MDQYLAWSMRHFNILKTKYCIWINYIQHILNSWFSYVPCNNPSYFIHLQANLRCQIVKILIAIILYIFVCIFWVISQNFCLFDPIRNVRFVLPHTIALVEDVNRACWPVADGVSTVVEVNPLRIPSVPSHATEFWLELIVDSWDDARGRGICSNTQPRKNNIPFHINFSYLIRKSFPSNL